MQTAPAKVARGTNPKPIPFHPKESNTCKHETSNPEILTLWNCRCGSFRTALITHPKAQSYPKAYIIWSLVVPKIP